MNTQLTDVPSPAYIIDEVCLEQNLKYFHYIKEKTKCKILLATKAYSCFSTYDLISEILDGTTNSSLHEAMLSAEYFGKETHVYSPAYKQADFEKIIEVADCITFNSLNQWQMFREKVTETIHIGLRINPEHVEVRNKMYSPCVPGSRFGLLYSDLENQDLTGISGFHIHALCQNNEDSLQRLMLATEEKFSVYLKRPEIKWINFGGGHMISKSSYNRDLLCELIQNFQNQYNVQVVLEPGESVVLNCGTLLTTVLDIVHNKMDIAIVDSSATAHMPDVLEMPYTPDCENAFKANESNHTYRIGGNTCLSGDIIGEYSFEKKLKIGDTLLFKDMAQYTMVKNTTFNGIPLPAIVIKRKSGIFDVIKEFNYDDFKKRLS